MFASRQIVSRFMQQTVRRYHAGEFKPPTIDELPVPRGPWQELHDKRQRRYNTQLALGVVFCIFSLVVAKTSGLVYLNYSPPKSLD